MRPVRIPRMGLQPKYLASDVPVSSRRSRSWPSLVFSSCHRSGRRSLWRTTTAVCAISSFNDNLALSESCARTKRKGSSSDTRALTGSNTLAAGKVSCSGNRSCECPKSTKRSTRVFSRRKTRNCSPYAARNHLFGVSRPTKQPCRPI